MAGVLIVEDDKELREMISISLTRRKFTVIEAVNGKEAIMRFKPSITDLVVTDLIMPEEDGLSDYEAEGIETLSESHCHFRRR
ncbi:MAG: response regulator [Bacteroidales bacterium]|nr:response regulator [Bacteroidales bacterium]